MYIDIFVRASLNKKQNLNHYQEQQQKSVLENNKLGKFKRI